MTRTINCVCCDTAASVPSGGSSVGDLAIASGFHPFFSQKSGLTTVWVCPTCITKVERASALLREVFGDDAEFIHMGAIARKA